VANKIVALKIADPKSGLKKRAPETRGATCSCEHKKKTRPNFSAARQFQGKDLGFSRFSRPAPGIPSPERLPPSSSCAFFPLGLR